MRHQPRSTGKWPWSALPSSALAPPIGLRSDALCPFRKPVRLATEHHRDIGKRSIPIEPAAPSRPHLSRLPALALLRRRPIVHGVTASLPASEKPSQIRTKLVATFCNEMGERCARVSLLGLATLCVGLGANLRAFAWINLAKKIENELIPRVRASHILASSRLIRGTRTGACRTWGREAGPGADNAQVMVQSGSTDWNVLSGRNPATGEGLRMLNEPAEDTISLTPRVGSMWVSRPGNRPRGRSCGTRRLSIGVAGQKRRRSRQPRRRTAPQSDVPWSAG